MTDLRKFQDRSQTQANLGAVPAAPPPTTTTLQSLGSFAQGIAPSVGRAVVAGQKAAAEERVNTKLGDFANKLANAQQAGKTDPNFNLENVQRQLYTEFIAQNPALAGDGIKMFTDATGLKPSGLTFEQKEMQDLQESAWSAGFGDPAAPPSENAKQLDLYQSIQRESKIMEHNAKVDSWNKSQKLTELQGSTAKLSTWKTESLYATLQTDLETLRNGGDRASLAAKWAKLSIDWSNELAQYGEFANDPTIKAQLSGIQDMLKFGKEMVDGTVELDNLTKQSDIALAKQKALFTSDPKGAELIALSQAFGHTPAAQVGTSLYVSEVIAKKGPSDIRDMNGEEKSFTRETISNMAGSEEPLARDEATGQVVQIAQHLDRNGMDYTDENILEVCSVLAVPKAFDQMSSGDKELVKNACDTYAVDVAQKAIRDIENNGSIAFPTEVITPRGDTRPGAPNVVPVQSFATIVADNTGLRYTALPEFRNNRQVQRQIQNLNRQLTKVNPVLEVYSAATGETPAFIANELWGLGNNARSQADIAAERPVEEPAQPEQPAPTQASQDQFKEEFIQASIEAGQSQEEAEALWAQVSAPVADAPASDVVMIGGQEFTREQAKAALSVPVQ